jgi:hypothetical protein
MDFFFFPMILIESSTRPLSVHSIHHVDTNYSDILTLKDLFLAEDIATILQIQHAEMTQRRGFIVCLICIVVCNASRMLSFRSLDDQVGLLSTTAELD